MVIFRRFTRVLVAAVALLVLLTACDGTTVQIGLETEAPSTPAAQPGGDAAVLTATPAPADPGQPTATPASVDGGTAEPAPATPDAGAPAVYETPGLDWVSMTSDQYSVVYRIPAGWQRQEGYDERYSGADGFVLLNAMGGTGQSDVLDLCQLEANHRLMPYGSAPQVERISGGAGGSVPGCIVIPSADAPSDGGYLVVFQYPQPVTIGQGVYPFFAMYGSGEHIRAVANSLQFVRPTVPPTATPQASGGSGEPARITRFDVSPLSGVAHGGAVQASWEAAGASAVLCQNFFRPTVTGEPASLCEDVPVSGSVAVTLPEDEDVFYVEMTLLVSDAQRTFSEIQLVQLACTDGWFFGGGEARCPVYEPFTMDAVAQPFERGWMIYVEDMLGSPLDNLYALFDVNGPVEAAGAERYVLFQNPTQGSAPDTLQPPAGLLAPDDRFYAAWSVAGIAEAGPDGTDGLGWAVGEPVSYRAQVQWGYHPHDDANWFYLSGPDGQVFALDEDEQAPPVDGRLVGEWYLYSE